jgi:hypothetical protein
MSGHKINEASTFRKIRPTAATVAILRNENEMKLQDFDSAWELTGKNKYRIFMKRPGHTDSGFERSIAQEFPDVRSSPKFKISKSEKVFTIGSCFARNVENILQRDGFDVITAKCSIPGDFYEMTGLGARNGALNAYTPHSMRDILRLPDRVDAQTAGILSDGDLRFDMVTSGLRPLEETESQLVRNRVLETYRRLQEADVVVITLGYTESWFDSADQMFINKSPAGSRRTLKHSSRYKFANATAEDVVSALRDIVDTISLRTNGMAKIILTVSPVPLHGTFTDRDVVSANLYSKSTLLSAAVSVSADYDNVDYFQSYELVTMSSPAYVWGGDGLHITSSVIQDVMRVFSSTYLASELGK